MAQTFRFQPHLGNFLIPYPSGAKVTTYDEARRQVFIPDTITDVPRAPGNNLAIDHGGLAAWNGHEFEIFRVASHSARDNYRNGYIRLWHKFDESFERQMIIYHPIDPRIVVADVRGATRAYPNAAGTAWLFAHTEEGTHHDYELRLMGAIDGVVQPYFRQLQVDEKSTNATVRQAAADRFVTLARFYGEVVVAARAIARAAFLGEREQQAHPREGWLDRDITAAVAQVRAKWAAEATTDDMNRIAPAVTYITQSLTMPTVETRWDRARAPGGCAQGRRGSCGERNGPGRRLGDGLPYVAV